MKYSSQSTVIVGTVRIIKTYSYFSLFLIEQLVQGKIDISKIKRSKIKELMNVISNDGSTLISETVKNNNN